MTDQDKNKMIAEWLDLITFFNKADGRWWYRPIDGDANLPIPDYYNTNEAFSLLDVLVERRYCYRLKDIGVGSMFQIWRREDFIGLADSVNKSKSQAIVNAILMLIEKEKQNSCKCETKFTCSGGEYLYDCECPVHKEKQK